jgi:hypothetical protein
MTPYWPPVRLEEEELTMDTPMTYNTDNVYMSAFLISQEEFKLGKVYIPIPGEKAVIEILYADKYHPLLEQLIETYESKKAIVRLESYQQNIRFIMKLVNKRKSNIND